MRDKAVEDIRKVISDVVGKDVSNEQLELIGDILIKYPMRALMDSDDSMRKEVIFPWVIFDIYESAATDSVSKSFGIGKKLRVKLIVKEDSVEEMDEMSGYLELTKDDTTKNRVVSRLNKESSLIEKYKNLNKSIACQSKVDVVDNVDNVEDVDSFKISVKNAVREALDEFVKGNPNIDLSISEDSKPSRLPENFFYDFDFPGKDKK